MRKIKSFFGITAWLAAMMLLALACSDGLDIHQRYLFGLETMPVPKKIVQGETVEIRCKLIREGDYKEARYYIRFFQTDGTGELRMDDGRVLTSNDLFPLTKEVFRLYYTSRCTDQQTIDVYIEDDAGQVIQKTFSFQNERVEEE
ncbi:conjugal transfer protein [Bacteroidia bacterium]|nr:conjugal transfer protein [Bacteroidia bacterium]